MLVDRVPDFQEGVVEVGLVLWAEVVEVGLVLWEEVEEVGHQT